MKFGLLEITLELYKKLDPGKIRDFCFISDIFEVLPHGFIRYWDTDGHTLAEYPGLSVGSSVTMKVTGEAQDEGTVVDFPEMMVGDLKLNDAADTSVFSGDLQIEFVHPWVLLRDPTPHAYEAMNNADLIKKILKDQARGREWPVDDAKFIKTDDDGTYPRYKSAETDYDFLIEKVLPYTAASQMPVHLYCDDGGDFWLRTLKELYKENPKVILGPKPEDFGLESISRQMEKSLKDNGIDEKDTYSINKAFLQVGSKEIDEEIYPSFVTENTNSGGTLTAKKKIGTYLKKNTDGKQFGGYLPVSNLLMSQTAGTKVKLVQNRSLVDSLMLMFAGSDKIDQMFRIAVSTDFLGGKVKIGDTVDVILPEVVYGDGELKPAGKYSHWLTGKWLVMRTEHSLMTGSMAKFVTNLYLARPTFVGNEKTTSLVNIPMLSGAA
jgi:hypothetical protein